ncbi:Glycosyl hydrolase family 76 [Actinopolymorpha cephalotaxi]|uniref:Alpha-1,6-mannanase (GH76 family) n=1 Tax=Actinopolymorpha cephalotaxi TaxID=504797 RepID=A0A1I2VE95_9ACTN|nr:glycoside hydrolase family 76 protein [Actinopolymorpha cephalotaxi]NYH84853.1 putative alpha-1,6-mannanase (GH76 family) [Actinopolymorpha cephalotaxi]SFG87532.1 Glycosyl hydrolase family 76 [Actinopolymorpha cephalotaxi]
MSRTPSRSSHLLPRVLAAAGTLALGLGVLTGTAAAAPQPVRVAPAHPAATGAAPAAAVSAARPGVAPVAAPVCGTLCDGAPVSEAREDRLADGTTIYGRSIELHLSDLDAMGWASINNGDPTDEVWLDRSYDGGKTVTDTKLGDATIPAGSRGTTTAMFNVNDRDNQRAGVLRACGKAGNRDDVVCTAWTGVERPNLEGTPTKRAVEALVKLYNKDTGLWKTTGWWNSANALTAVLDYELATGDRSYDWIIANTYDKNLHAQHGNFTNDYIDDTGWWALAWIRAYDLTGQQRYLDTAKFDVDYMWSTHDDVCGGGVVWNVNQRYKNAVTNELFVKAAASLHNRIPGDTQYLDRALNIWQWFRASGMINADNLINDGLNGTTCQNNGGTTWTYNQGIVLGALTELAAATKDTSYLAQARVLADASTGSEYLNPGGVLTEPCEPNGCGGDGPTFKGVYVRNLGELNAVLRGRPYQRYLQRQATASYLRDRNRFDQYGVHWAGPIESISAATQQSATEAQIAPLWGRGPNQG